MAEQIISAQRGVRVDTDLEQAEERKANVGIQERYHALAEVVENETTQKR